MSKDCWVITSVTTDEYYHFTSAEYTELTNWLDDVVLSDDGSIATNGNILINSDKKITLDGVGNIWIGHISASNYVEIDCGGADDLFLSSGDLLINDVLKVDDIVEYNIGNGVLIEDVLLNEGNMHILDNNIISLGSSPT